MKKMIATVLLGVMVVSMTACGSGKTAGENKQTDQQVQEDTDDTLIGGDPSTWGPADDAQDNTQIPNPFVETTREEAERLSGLSFTVPETVEGYNSCIFMAIENELIQAYYTKENVQPADSGDGQGTDQSDNDTIDPSTVQDTDELLIRKAAGSDDISGDYNNYEQISFATVNDVEVTMKGNNDLVSVAIWTDNGYTFAVDTNNPITIDQMKEIIGNVR